MRKALYLLLAGLLVVSFALPAVAAQTYGSQNISVLGPGMGGTGTTPATQVVKVRYAMQQANSLSLSSGDVVVWDTTSADGLTISACVADSDGTYAGVLVTGMHTAESANTSTSRAGTRNWGYMAVKGYCLAKVDTSASTAGNKLVVNGATLSRSFRTAADTLSPDTVGVLLKDTAADGLMPVWLE